MDIIAKQTSFTAEQNDILIGLEMVEDIHCIFSEINQLKSQLADLSALKDQYSSAINELYEVTIENSWTGEWISKKALELGLLIRGSLLAYKRIKELETKLAEKYGFPYEDNQADV